MNEGKNTWKGKSQHDVTTLTPGNNQTQRPFEWRSDERAKLGLIMHSVSCSLDQLCCSWIPAGLQWPLTGGFQHVSGHHLATKEAQCVLTNILTQRGNEHWHFLPRNSSQLCSSTKDSHWPAGATFCYNFSQLQHKLLEYHHSIFKYALYGGHNLLKSLKNTVLHRSLLFSLFKLFDPLIMQYIKQMRTPWIVKDTMCEIMCMCVCVCILWHFWGTKINTANHLCFKIDREDQGCGQAVWLYVVAWQDSGAQPFFLFFLVQSRVLLQILRFGFDRVAHSGKIRQCRAKNKNFLKAEMQHI